MKKVNYTLAAAAIALVSLFGASQAMAEPQQGECHRGHSERNAERTVELLENGFIVTVTSDDADEVARIQAHAQRRAEFDAMSPEEREAVMEERRERRGQSERGSHGEHRRGPGHGLRDLPLDDVERVIVNLDNGIQIVTTSADPEVAERLIELGQEMAERGDRGRRHHRR